MRGFFSLVSQTLVTLTVVDSALAVPSAGCGKAPTLKPNNTVTSSSYFIVKSPDGYDNKKPYRLVFTFHALGAAVPSLLKEASAPPTGTFRRSPTTQPSSSPPTDRKPEA